MRGGLDPRVSETARVLGLQSKSYPYTKLSLKKDVYGTERPSLALETQRATEEARRLSQHLDLLQRLVPTGFGSLARDIRGWLHNVPNPSGDYHQRGASKNPASFLAPRSLIKSN